MQYLRQMLYFQTHPLTDFHECQGQTLLLMLLIICFQELERKDPTLLFIKKHFINLKI